MKLLNVCKCVRYSATIKPFPELRKEDWGFESRGPTCPMILTDLLSHLAISPAGCGREARGWGWGKLCFPSEKQKDRQTNKKTEKQKDRKTERQKRRKTRTDFDLANDYCRFAHERVACYLWNGKIKITEIW